MTGVFRGIATENGDGNDTEPIVYVGSGDGILYAFNTTDGSIKW